MPCGHPARHVAVRVSLQRRHDQAGFTLTELLVTVLVIGILATLIIPKFVGQRNGSENARSQHAVRASIDTIESYRVNHNDTFSGLDRVRLNADEPALAERLPLNQSGIPYATMAAAAAATPGPHADPHALYIASDAAGTPPTANLVYSCSVSKGDKILCARGDADGWTYARSSSTSQTVADVINNVTFNADLDGTTSADDGDPEGDSGTTHCTPVVGSPVTFNLPLIDNFNRADGRVDANGGTKWASDGLHNGSTNGWTENNELGMALDSDTDRDAALADQYGPDLDLALTVKTPSADGEYYALFYSVDQIGFHGGLGTFAGNALVIVKGATHDTWLLRRYDNTGSFNFTPTACAASVPTMGPGDRFRVSKRDGHHVAWVARAGTPNVWQEVAASDDGTYSGAGFAAYEGSDRNARLDDLSGGTRP